MAGMVIAGDHKGSAVELGFGSLTIRNGFKKFKLSKDNIESYEVVNDEQRKSATSGVARGLVGGALLGPVGLLAGGLSAKNKGTYQVSLEFKDGKKSLIQVDDTIYKTLIRILY